MKCSFLYTAPALNKLSLFAGNVCSRLPKPMQQ